MERSELYQELHSAISTDECEIICLEEQIKLLAKIKSELVDKPEIPFALLQFHINALQNQIETITALI